MNRSTFRSLLCDGVPRMLPAALTLALALAVAAPAWAGPYLRVSNELSKARSTRECGNQAAKVMYDLQREKRLRVDKDNPRLGVTRDSTVYVECIFVGKNEHKRDQWIFHVSIASTSAQESAQLLDLLRKKLGSWTRID